jgi:hypothetical protein
MIAIRTEPVTLDAKLIAAEWYVGDLYGEDMPGIARRALELGHDGKNLRRLAGLDRPTKRDVARLVDRALRELGVRAPISERDAAVWMARRVAQEIIEGKIEPYRGACRIWLIYSYGVPELRHWSYLATDHEAALGTDQTKLAEQEIIDSAKSLCLKLFDAFEEDVAGDG